MKTMKKIMLAFVVVASVASINLFAQDKKGDKNQEEWKAKMESARIAFITNELKLTSDEAQKFWPVYNEVSEKRNKAFFESGVAFQKLDEAVKNGEECSKLLDAYIEAQTEVAEINAEAVKAYKKVLPANKVAKLFVLEENFRKHLLGRLGNGGGHGGPKPGQNEERPQMPFGPGPGNGPGHGFGPEGGRN